MAFTGNYTCDTFKSGLLAGSFDFATPTADTYKIALYTADATLNASTTAYTSDNEVVVSGYTAGGETITPSVGITNGVAYLTFSDSIWTASLTARGALIYKVGGGNTALFVLDFGSDKTSSTEFKVEFPAATYTSALVRIS
jgi:hypothetical protein